jgi:hypothetical protein
MRDKPGMDAERLGEHIHGDEREAEARGARA